MPFRFRLLQTQLQANARKILSIAVASLMTSSIAVAQEPAADAVPTASKGNVLEQFWVGLGPMYFIIFLIMSVILVALVVRSILAVQRSNFVPADLVQGIESSLEQNNPQAAAELIKTDESFLGNLLNAGLGQLTKGKEAVLESMQVAGDSETMRIEQLIGYIARLVTSLQ